jgi:hypothetical protein
MSSSGRTADDKLSQMVDEFSRRADTIIWTGWPRVAIFYFYLLKHVKKV